MIHASAIVEGVEIHESSNVWAYAHVMAGAEIGKRVNIGDHCFVEAGSSIGDNVTVKNGVCIWEGVHIEDDVFVGPQATFTNDKFPRSPRMAGLGDKYKSKQKWLLHTRIGRGSTLGARSVVLPGVQIGRYAMVGAGAVVTENVPPFALVVGSPARPAGIVCVCGEKLEQSKSTTSECAVCGRGAAEREAMLAD
ncbi:MAG: acyltransferase [Aureliella sp.]